MLKCISRFGEREEEAVWSEEGNKYNVWNRAAVTLYKSVNSGSFQVNFQQIYK